MSGDSGWAGTQDRQRRTRRPRRGWSERRGGRLLPSGPLGAVMSFSFCAEGLTVAAALQAESWLANV